MVWVGKGQRTVRLYSASKKQIATSYQHEITLQDPLDHRASTINLGAKPVIRSERVEGRSFDEDLHRRCGLKQLVCIDRIDDLVRVRRVELDAPTPVLELRPVNNLFDAARHIELLWTAGRLHHSRCAALG